MPGGDILLDTQNMLGVALDATDDCDSTYDIAELTDTPNIWAKLHFPHQDWDCALVSGSKYNNDMTMFREHLGLKRKHDGTYTRKQLAAAAAKALRKSFKGKR